MTCTRDCWHPLEQLVVWFRGLKPSEDTCLPKDALAGPSCGADASFLGCAPSCWASCLLEMPLWGVAVSRIYQRCSCWATTSFGGCCLETRTLSKRHNPSTLSRWHLTLSLSTHLLTTSFMERAVLFPVGTGQRCEYSASHACHAWSRECPHWFQRGQAESWPMAKLSVLQNSGSQIFVLRVKTLS